MNRQSGFYWVSYGGGGWGMWTVAFFNGSKWSSQVWSGWVDESTLHEIDENLIVRGVK